jgi:hypothetical protein
LFAFGAKTIPSDRGQQTQQAIGSGLIVYPALVRVVIFHTSAQFYTVNLRFPQNASHIFDADKLQQQIGREIAAPTDHRVRKRRYFRCSSNCRIELGCCIAILGQAKNGSICRAEKTVPNVQRVIKSKTAFVCGTKYGEQHCHFDRACSMKPPVAPQRKSQSGLKIVQRYGDGSSFVFGSQSFQLLV